MIKLNFDGASNGNPREAGYSNIFRDSQGRVLQVYAVDCGIACTNKAKFNVVEQDLIIVKQEIIQKISSGRGFNLGDKNN